MKMKAQDCVLSILGASAITYALVYLYAYVAPINFIQSIAALQFVNPQAVIIDLTVKNYIMGVISLTVFILIFLHAFYYIHKRQK